MFLLLVRRFVAGERLEDAVAIAKKQCKDGLYPIINILGEHVKERETALRFFCQYLALIYLLNKEGLPNAHISIKPSQLGFDISPLLYRNYLSEILEYAAQKIPDGLVEIDAEDERYCCGVQTVSLSLAKNQRICRQANIDITAIQIEKIINAGLSVRLCKGAYEGNVKDVKRRYLELANILIGAGRTSSIATHDLRLLAKIKDRRLEIQMLLGIENGFAKRLAAAGFRVGIYIPCGKDWMAFARRRWKTVPAIILRNAWHRIRYRKELKSLLQG